MKQRGNTLKKRSLPLSGIILVVLMLTTFLTAMVAEQRQESQSLAQEAKSSDNQVCNADTKIKLGMLEPFCGKEEYKNSKVCGGAQGFCKRDETSRLCQPDGIYGCKQPNTCENACDTRSTEVTASFCPNSQKCCTTLLTPSRLSVVSQLPNAVEAKPVIHRATPPRKVPPPPAAPPKVVKKVSGAACGSDVECQAGLVCRTFSSGGIISGQKTCLAPAVSLPNHSRCKNDSECTSKKCRPISFGSVGTTAYRCIP